jgi:Flp pilus assembly protein TadG
MRFGRGSPVWGSRGQSMVEFALILPIFILVTIGVIDFGRAFWYYNEIGNAVREGARVATYDQNITNIKNAVVSHTTIGLTAADVTVTCYSGFTSTTKSCTGLSLGDGVKVSATKAFQPITGQVVQLVGSGIDVTNSSMRSVQ